LKYRTSNAASSSMGAQAAQGSAKPGDKTDTFNAVFIATESRAHNQSDLRQDLTHISNAFASRPATNAWNGFRAFAAQAPHGFIIERRTFLKPDFRDSWP
jgi:hypothetical protein